MEKAVAIIQTAEAGANLNYLDGIALPTLVGSGHDFLVKVRAISINPVDTCGLLELPSFCDRL